MFMAPPPPLAPKCSVSHYLPHILLSPVGSPYYSKSANGNWRVGFQISSCVYILVFSCSESDLISLFHAAFLLFNPEHEGNRLTFARLHGIMSLKIESIELFIITVARTSYPTKMKDLSFALNFAKIFVIPWLLFSRLQHKGLVPSSFAI
jgi:hypothetical protein